MKLIFLFIQKLREIKGDKRKFILLLLFECSPGLGTQALCKPFSPFLTTSLVSVEFQTTFSCIWWQSKWMGEATYGIWRWLLRYKWRTERGRGKRDDEPNSVTSCYVLPYLRNLIFKSLNSNPILQDVTIPIISTKGTFL